MHHQNTDKIASPRRHDIDWLRVIAIGILLVFHIMVMFQSYAKRIEFVQSPNLLEILLVPLSLFSIMRIPLLFFVSGMGVFFSLQKRTWLQLIGERTLRILVPLVFGTAAIVPIQLYIFAEFYGNEFVYRVDVHHLWFLINIYMYVLWFLALFYFHKEITNSIVFDILKNILTKYPYSIYLFAVPYLLQALTIPANTPYALYYDSGVGLMLGGIAFLLGFTFVAIGKPFWQAVSNYRYYTLTLAFVLFLIRISVFKSHGPHLMTSLESISWIYCAFGFGYTYLNKPGRLLSYLSPAAYPFYIVHMIFLNLGGYIIFPLNLNAWVSLLLIVLITFTGCFISYEILKRIFFLRPLFGMKIRK